MREQVFFADVAEHRAKTDALYVHVRDEIRRLLPSAIVEHVGSTALPDGLTKGDLDVQVRVRADEFVHACQTLEQLYDDNPGGFTDAGRSFKDDSTDPPLGVHVTVIDGPSDIQSKQRDLLRRRPDLRAEYDAVKRRFDGGDMDAYRVAKDIFFTRIAATTSSERLVRPYNGRIDREACLAIFDSNTPTFFDTKEREEFAAFLDIQRDRYFVVEEPAGFVACGGWGSREPRVALLCWGMVRRDYHRRGIGTLLLAHRLSEIAREGFEEIEIVTSQHSKPFFAAAGFVEVDVRANLFAPGLNGHRMRRRR
jgi:GrpB-like predicted nucleotidyltransferase (UPF0157 family)/ribosomal protein S18 acetylase RimI-like enzyme